MISDNLKRTLVTPKMAEEWLNHNNVNRTLMPGTAEKYAADMIAGRWTDCIAPIAFYEDTKDIADGQHRLYAIIESGTTQKFYVVHDLPRPAGLNIDTGRGRTLVDNSRIAGLDDGLSNQLIAYTRGINDGTRIVTRRTRTNAEVLDIVATHRESAEWVIKHSPVGRGLRNGPLCAALGRAWYIEDDKDRLAKFSEVLGKGFSEGPADSAAVAMRNYLLMKAAARIEVTSSANWRDTFLKAQNAIRYFMQRKSLTNIKTIADEAYPLSGSTRKVATKEGRTAQNKANQAAKRATS